jgi:hypothetical protein
MSAQFNADQVLNLAANANARKNAKSLAKTSKWLSLGTDGRAVWGEVKGSSSSPYQARIDLTEPAFKCNCTSRQHPCKHTIGLFLLYVEDATVFTDIKPPQWVTSWISSRDTRAAKKASGKTGVTDPKAQAKRIAEREKKVQNGLEELDLWLRDVVRNGLANVQGNGYDFWDKLAARMIDAQAKGVANQIKELAGVPVSGDGWPERLLERLSRLYLLAEGYRNLEGLPPETQADVRSVVGWTQKQEELMALPAVRDEWLVIGRRAERQDTINSQRTWLWSARTGQAALILEFSSGGNYGGGAAFEMTLPAGACFEADLIYYPSEVPLRAIIKERRSSAILPEAVPAYTLVEAIEAYSAALALNPWIGLFPLLLSNAIPTQLDGRAVLRDPEGRVMPVSTQFTATWNLMAISGGHPLMLSGEWNGDDFLPLAAWADGRTYVF